MDKRFGYTFFQEAYFVNSVEESAQKWSDLFGAGPFRVAPHHQTDTFTYRGTDQEADVTYAFGYLGDIMIQFIEQHDETPSIYRDMFKRGEEGFHHVAVLVHDFKAEYKRLENLGFECATHLFADNVDAAYFDTRAVNYCFTEIHGDPPNILGRWATMKRAHEVWQPGDSAFMTL